MSEHITYGSIENALTRLGFEVTVGPNYRLYRHAATETVITTPDYPLERAADAMRLASVRTLIAARGIARPERLEHLLAAPVSLKPIPSQHSTRQITHIIPDEVKV